MGVLVMAVAAGLALYAGASQWSWFWIVVATLGWTAGYALDRPRTVALAWERRDPFGPLGVLAVNAMQCASIFVVGRGLKLFF